MTQNTEKLLTCLAELNCKIEKTKYGAIIITPSAKLEPEEAQEEPKFKDGDFVCLDNLIFIYKSTELGYVRAYASLCQECLSVGVEILCEERISESFKYATDEEKQLLINALYQERKLWDHETMQVKEDRNPRIGDKCVFWDEGDTDVVVSNLYDLDGEASQYNTDESGSYENCVRFQDFDFETMKPHEK